MGKHMRRVLACGLLAIVLGTLVACSGGAASSGGEDAKAAFEGTWSLAEMSGDEESASAEDIELMRSLGYEATLELASDATLTLDVFGDEMTGTWSASSTTEATAKMDGQDVSMKIEGGKLVMSQDDTDVVMTFARGSQIDATDTDEVTPVAPEEEVAPGEDVDESTSEESAE